MTSLRNRRPSSFTKQSAASSEQEAANSKHFSRLMNLEGLSGIKRTQPVSRSKSFRQACASAMLRRAPGSRGRGSVVEKSTKAMVEATTGRRSDDSDYSVTHRLAEAGRSGRLLGGGLSGLKGGGGRRRGNNDFYVGGDSVVAPPADHELKAAEEVARISQGDRDAEAAPAADP